MKSLGLIVEDRSDLDVVRELVGKIAKNAYRIRPVFGHGCGRINAKSQRWAMELHRQGCQLLMLVCDLDSRRLRDLLLDLNTSLHPCPIQTYSIVIPVREIEAWLLADHEAISRALNLRKKLGKQANPEAIVDPKKRLSILVRERSGGRLIYLNTVHNRKIAKQVEISNLRRCLSFHNFEEFICAHR